MSLAKKVYPAVEHPESGDGGPKRWHQQDILAEIRKRGSSISELARANNVQRGTLNAVFYKRYPRGQAIVADFLGLTRHDLWPHWYGPDDKPLPLQGGPRRHSRKQAA